MTVRSLAVATPESSTSEPELRPARDVFAELDDATTSGRAGAFVVTLHDHDRRALLAHVGRRLRAAGAVVVEVSGDSSTSIFREVATQLGLGALPCVPRAYAEAIANASRQRIAVLAPLPQVASWDDVVARELAELATATLVFVTSSASAAWATSTFDLRAELSSADKFRWLSAIVYASDSLIHENDLRGLEAWWKTRELRKNPPSEATLSEQARELAIALALAGRSVPLAALGRTSVNVRAVDELLSANVLIPNATALVLSPSIGVAQFEAQGSKETRALAARLLLAETDALDLDPWAPARAAELLLSDAPLLANDAMDRAFRAARDSRIVVALAEGWLAAVSNVKGAHGLELRLRGAERALSMSKPEDALRWCASLTEEEAEEPRVRIAMAKARAQLGDLVSAQLILDRLAVPEADVELRAIVASERSEVRYLAGDLDAAVRDAEAAFSLSTAPRTRLAARSVLGKVLLARGEWDNADAHFAADALAARSAGETTAELRARLNRGIVLLSKGLLDEARRTLDDVLENSERLGELRAVSLALSNLGVVAYRQRDLTAALRYWERALAQCDALGGRVAAAHRIANLADLRLKLGLVDNAEHAILFGQRMLAGSLTPARAAQFKLVSAQVALARGSTEVARDEVRSAMVHAHASGDIAYVGAVAIVGARIALADGDVDSTGEWIEVAAAHAKTDRPIAELAMVRAMHYRAIGQPALEAATEALALARVAAEDDLLIDIHILVATCARDEGDWSSARTHCTRAAAIRDRVATPLPSDVREAFLSKPEMIALERLRRSLGEDSPNDEELAPLSMLRPPVPSRPRGSELVGVDPQMQTLELTIRKAARSDGIILVTGESGTGKELVARALHAASSRAARPFVVVNCAALVETLLLSELFGHERGAFTGANMRRRGRFEIADDGTLFLDEIGDISPRTQVALLRVLQEKTFERVGGTTSIRTNARVICATHRDLRSMVDRGEFREDLYYRIRGITLEVPPLRTRTGDIPLIASHILSRLASTQGTRPRKVSADALKRLVQHHWPGNVRELENVLRAASVFAEGETITLFDLLEASADLRRGVDPNGLVDRTNSSVERSTLAERDEDEHEDEDDSSVPSDNGRNDLQLTASAYAHVREQGISLHHMKRLLERDCIAAALAESHGNITRAAELLGMKRPRVSQLAKQYGLSTTTMTPEEAK